MALGATAGAAAALAGTGGGPAAAASAAGTAPTTAAAGAARTPAGCRMTARALGVNTTSGDTRFTDAPVAPLLRDAHIGVVRYPGGGGADFFAWETGGPVTWPQYMGVMASVGAVPLITVNYGQLAQGPDAAAAWVRSADTYANYDSATALWVLGNEEYGAWELDQHPDPHTPESFAANALPYFQAMHAANPATQVGFPLTVPREISGGTGTWVADPDLWNRTILAKDGPEVDFVDFHWYPVFGIPVLSNAQIFETVQRIPGVMRYLRGLLDEYDSKAYLITGESNISQSEIVYNVQPVAALYAAATSLTFLANGSLGYLWWQIHNSDSMNGDFGFLSNGTGSPGPSATALRSAAAPGARHIDVADTTGFYYGHRFTVDTGDALESRKITAIGGTTTLAAPAVARATTVTVESVVPFATGTPITIGTGATQESRTVASVGTGASEAVLAAPAARGDRLLRIVGQGMGGQSIPVFMPIGFAPGARVTVGTGATAETAVVEQVGTSSSLGTTTVAPARPGDRTVYVAGVTDTGTGLANYVGDPITIGAGAGEEVGVVAAVGTGAASPTTLTAAVAAGARGLLLASTAGVTVGHPLLLGSGAGAEITAPVSAVSTGAAGNPVTLSAPVRGSYAAGDAVRDIGSGITLAAPLRRGHATGVPTRDTGSGLTLRAPLRHAHATGEAAATPGTGVVLSAPLRRAHAAGDAAVSTGITFTPALSAPHAPGASVNELGLKEPAPDTPLPAYWGFTLAALLTTPGAYLTTLPSPAPTVLAFRSFLPGTSETVMLINTDDEHGAVVRTRGFAVRGGTGVALATYGYSLANPSVTRGATTVGHADAGLALPAESITVLVAAAGDEESEVALSVTPGTAPDPAR